LEWGDGKYQGGVFLEWVMENIREGFFGVG
jgi:hypothetical protein